MTDTGLLYLKSCATVCIPLINMHLSISEPPGTWNRAFIYLDWKDSCKMLFGFHVCFYAKLYGTWILEIWYTGICLFGLQFAGPIHNHLKGT